MNAWLLLAVFWLPGSYGGGVSNTDGEDFSEFWADDFKNSGHLYAKTSDKDLFGATLPPSVTFDVPATQVKGGSLEKTVQYGDLSQASSTYPYNYGQVYKKQAAKGLKKTEDSAYNSYSQSGLVQSQDYLKPLKHQLDEFPYGGFKAYIALGDNPDISDDYGGIHNVVGSPSGERAIGSVSEEIPEDTKVYANNKARSKVRLLRGNGLQSRTKCRAGICRKKAKNTSRVYPRPTKRIKKIVYNY